MKHKFRAWDKILECYTKNSMQLFHNEGIITFDAGTRYVFEQYTGLKDKDGVEICEGDVVKFEGHVGDFFEDGRREMLMGEVFYKTEGSVDYCFRVGSSNYGLNSNGVSKYKVIGNIHQNKKLLQEKK